MPKIEGFQILDTKVSELANFGKAYLTVIIEKKGCKFAGTVEIKGTIDPTEDVFSTARTKAVKQALASAERSDLVLYGKPSGQSARGGGGPFRGKGKQNPDTPATPKQVNRLFAIAKDLGIMPDVVSKTIKNKGLDQNALTVGQVDNFIAKIKGQGGNK